MRIFSISDPGSASKNLSILIQKNGFWALGNMIRIVHPWSGSLLFTHPGSPIKGSKRLQIHIRNTGSYSPVPGHWLVGRYTEDDFSAEEQQLLLAFPSFQDIDFVEGIRQEMSPLEEK